MKGAREPRTEVGKFEFGHARAARQANWRAALAWMYVRAGRGALLAGRSESERASETLPALKKMAAELARRASVQSVRRWLMRSGAPRLKVRASGRAHTDVVLRLICKLAFGAAEAAAKASEFVRAFTGPPACRLTLACLAKTIRQHLAGKRPRQSHWRLD